MYELIKHTIIDTQFISLSFLKGKNQKKLILLYGLAMPRVLQNDDVDYYKFEFTGREMIYVCLMGSLKV